MKACRACLGKNLYMFLPLGDHPPANAFVTREQAAKGPQAAFPLDVTACLDCGVVEVPDMLPPDFFQDYHYVPSASATMHAHFANFAKLVKERYSAPDALVVDIGCNDGLFLKACKDIGLKTLGVEPAANIAAMAREKGIEIVNEYFGAEMATRVKAKYGPASVITTTNTFNHIDDLHAFMKGVDIWLKDGGTFIVEVPQALELVEKNEFDTVYHEHMSTFSVTSLAALYRFFGMKIVNVEVLPIHGGSMRVSAQRQPANAAETPIAQEWLDKEKAHGLFKRETYDALAGRVANIRAGLMKLLTDLKKQGKRLAGYGAPAKGNTLLNYYKIGPDLLDFLADKNALKQGKLSPGMHIPVVPAERVLEAQPDYVLILAWNFADEIMQQQAEYKKRGGKFILPIPEPRVV
ncbi:MAG TPA: class I SAM-dependent methyltransferase [Gemmatimonadaceae bacterium]|nr:class I SAM-dependent methyltransferase [Gemmatimonadaceae bacterium]